MLNNLVVHAHASHTVAEPAEADRARRNLLAHMPSEPMDEATRAPAQAALGFDLSRIRIHADRSAAESAEAVQARAYTFGEHVVFGHGQYAPGTPQGRRLLLHELGHVAQQRQSGSQVVQCDSDPAALRKRLQEVRDRLAKLRGASDRSMDDFSRSRADERQRESLERGDRAMQPHRAQARSNSAARELWGGTVAAARVRRVVKATQSGNTMILSAGMQLKYAGMTDKAARERAERDIPRIEATIRRVWQVSITSGEYAGVDFRLLPTVVYLPPGAPRSEDAFLIGVRTPDDKPSEGISVTGEISIAPVHLEGDRITVIAHELAHLFGFMDTYLSITSTDQQGKEIEQFGVGRDDGSGRADLLGMVDPAFLDKKVKSGAVKAQDAARQKKPVTVWEEEASIVLRTLGIAPPTAKPPPDPDSDDFDPSVELERLRREGEGKLAPIRERRRRAEDSLKWLENAEEIMKLEQEERDLTKRLGPAG